MGYQAGGRWSTRTQPRPASSGSWRRRGPPSQCRKVKGLGDTKRLVDVSNNGCRRPACCDEGSSCCAPAGSGRARPISRLRRRSLASYVPYGMMPVSDRVWRISSRPVPEYNCWTRGRPHQDCSMATAIRLVADHAATTRGRTMVAGQIERTVNRPGYGEAGKPGRGINQLKQSGRDEARTVSVS